MVTVALAAMLAALAMPAFRVWIANSKVRGAAESVTSQLRLAQAEAVKRYRRVVLYRAAATDCVTAPNASGSGNYWVIKTLPLYTGDQVALVQCGNFADTAGDVTVNGPAAVCLGTNGWPMAVADPGIGGTACTLPGNVITYTVSKPGVADRSLQVSLAIGGQVRMCDATKIYSTANPDGC